MHVDVKINQVGVVSGGEHDGQLIKVVPIDETPHFYIFYCDGPLFDLNRALDDWVEDHDRLDSYFARMRQTGATVDWQH